MRGILLAGGTGSRLWPITQAVSKQLMPVFDKPMIYYPLTTLVAAGIREIMIITTPDDQDQFRRLLGDGSRFGLELRYAAQPRPDGIAQAFLIARDFVAGEPVALILGDNLFHGGSVGRPLYPGETLDGGLIFACHVSNPEDYGVVEFRPDGTVVSIEEKPKQPKSRYVVPGLYFYDADVVKIAENLRPSARGELEITDINTEYMRQGRLHVRTLDRGTAWLDTGTFGSLVAAAEYVRVIEERQGSKIGCIEEASWRAGFIDSDRLRGLAGPLLRSGYGRYLMELLEER